MLSEAAGSWFRLFYESGDIIVTHVDLAPHAQREARALAWLDDTEKDRWRRFRFDRPRREFALCRAALRAVLCHRLGCTNTELAFGAAAYGKPFAVVGGTALPFNFNVSHSGRHGLVAFARGRRLGVDVEDRSRSPDIGAVAGAVFGPNEQAELRAAGVSQKARLFLRLWTQKEALIKACGTGFSMDVSEFELPETMRRGMRKGVFRLPRVPNFVWCLENIGCADFAAAIAYELDQRRALQLEAGHVL